jgi:hypothetical protein
LLFLNKFYGNTPNPTIAATQPPLRMFCVRGRGVNGVYTPMVRTHNQTRQQSGEVRPAGMESQGRWYYASSAAYWTKVHPPELSVSCWAVRAQATVPIKKRTLNAIEMNRAWWGPTINSGEGYVIEAMGLSSRNEVQRDGGTRTGSPKMNIMRR